MVGGRESGQDAVANVGYARVSTIDQDLALQRDALEAAGCVKVFEDCASGARADRAGLRAALDYARDGDVLIVWKLLYSGNPHYRAIVDFLSRCLDPVCGFVPRDQTSLRGRHAGRRIMGSEGRAVTSRPRRAGTAYGPAVNFQIALASPSVP